MVKISLLTAKSKTDFQSFILAIHDGLRSESSSDLDPGYLRELV